MINKIPISLIFLLFISVNVLFMCINYIQNYFKYKDLCPDIPGYDEVGVFEGKNINQCNYFNLTSNTSCSRIYFDSQHYDNKTIVYNSC